MPIGTNSSRASQSAHSAFRCLICWLGLLSCPPTFWLRWDCWFRKCWRFSRRGSWRWWWVRIQVFWRSRRSFWLSYGHWTHPELFLCLGRWSGKLPHRQRSSWTILQRWRSNQKANPTRISTEDFLLSHKFIKFRYLSPGQENLYG